MKKALALLLALVMVLSLAACGNKEVANDTNDNIGTIALPYNDEEATNDAEDTVGTITLSYKDKESETMTIKEYSMLCHDNALKFNKINEGAVLTITGYAQEVRDEVNINGLLFSNGYVYLTSEKTPFPDKRGFAMDGIYISPESKDVLADIGTDSVVTLIGKYCGNNIHDPIIDAISELEILDN